MARPSRYSSEVRQRAFRMVREHSAEHPSQWAAISSIAGKLGCTAETLRAAGSAKRSATRATPGFDHRRAATTERTGARES